MTIRKYKHAPFGSNVYRFGKITVHPRLDPNGLYAKRPSACDPCLYHPKSINEVFEINKKRKVNKDPWRYESDLEDWARNLGYRNQKVLKERKWFNSILGPAWHEVLEAAEYSPSCKNLGFGRTPRFKPCKNDLPGPGTYSKSCRFKTKYGPHSTRPTFEREEPCRFKDMSPKWSLAANRYTIVDKNSVEVKSKTIISLRGPYDLFTGKRDGSTINNHFNTSLKCSAATWPISLKGTLDKYTKSRFGEFNKTNRDLPHRGRNILVDLSMCLRKAEDPGPAHYNPYKSKVFTQNQWGFNSSYDKPRGYKREIVWPGVGRYSVKSIACGIRGQGHRHVFLSKQQRTIGAILPKPMNSF